MGIIKLDTPEALEFGFTSDKFDGYLWRDDKRPGFMWISFIESMIQRKGHLRTLLDTIERKGYNVIVPTPSARMEAICNVRGMSKHTMIIEEYNNEPIDKVEVMIKPMYAKQLNAKLNERDFIYSKRRSKVSKKTS